MDGSGRLMRLLGLLLLTGLTGCHGWFFCPPPPGYAYGANPAVGGGYGSPYSDCVDGGYSHYGYGPAGHGRNLVHDVRANLQARRANRNHRYPGHRHGHKGMGHGDIGCDSYIDVGCDGSGMCDFDGGCDSCDGCCSYDMDCCDPCMSCDSCGCGNMCGCGGMMGTTNPGPYIAYLIPMESYQGETCCDAMPGCGSCGSGIIQGEVIDNGFGDGGSCLSGDCQTYSGGDQSWQIDPAQLPVPGGIDSGDNLQPIQQRPQETLPVPPRSDDPVEEGDFNRQQSTPGDGNQAGFLVPKSNLLVPNQL